jgi:hypothetical protein
VLMTISTYLDKERMDCARHTGIVNSSGTGKSRALALNVFAVPCAFAKMEAKVSLSLAPLLLGLINRIPSP